MELDPEKYSLGFTKVYEISPPSLEVVTIDGRRIRITALKKVLGGMMPGYYSTYEEQIRVGLAGSRQTIWVDAPYSSAYADDAAACLRQALSLVVNPQSSAGRQSP